MRDMTEPLHDDDPAATVEVDGRQVRNLTAEEYAASYADGQPHELPPDVLAALPREDA
jgi:hypothetical protein